MSQPRYSPIGHSDRLRRETLGTQIVRAVRLDVLFGRYKPGQSISQTDLCDRFGVSRIPARDAIASLIREGVLIRESNGRTHAVEYSVETLEDMFQIDAILHGFAARRAAERATTEEVDAIEAFAVEMAELGPAPDPEHAAQLNFQFHRAINLATHSTRLMAALAAASTGTRTEFMVEHPEWIDKSNREHVEMVKALRNRRGATADRLMRQHFIDSGKQITDTIMERRSAPDVPAD